VKRPKITFFEVVEKTLRTTFPLVGSTRFEPETDLKGVRMGF
jgi:hypothetical protein